MIANIGSICSMWPRSGNAFAFRRRRCWSRLAAGATGGWVDLVPRVQVQDLTVRDVLLYSMSIQ